MVLFNMSHRLWNLQFLHETGLNFHFFCCWCQFLRKMILVLECMEKAESTESTDKNLGLKETWAAGSFFLPLYVRALYLVKGLVMHHNIFLSFSFIHIENIEVCRTGCPGKWWNHHPGKCSKNKEVWCLGTGCSGGPDSIRSMIRT